MMHVFCVSHRAPLFDIPISYTLVTPAAISGSHVFHVPDDSLGPAFDGRVLSEYLQLFALADLLRAKQASGKMYIFQYRKFTSYIKPPVQSKNLPWYQVSNELDASRYFPKLNVLESIDADLMVGPSIMHHGKAVAQAYAISHVIEDFINFALSLRELPGFDQNVCNRFVNSQFLIPAPSLGFCKINFFIETMDTLRKAWSIFFQHYYRPRDGFQRRVGGFLLERLHSFLIYDYYVTRGLGKAVSGVNVVISDSDYVAQTW